MTTKIEICNRALAKIGDDYTITSFYDEIKTARFSELLYESTKNMLLRSYPWRFAVKRFNSPELAETPAYGYNHQYLIPWDCLRVLSLQDENLEYAVEGRNILVNNDGGSLRYLGIKKVDDPNEYDEMFTEALVLKLAVEFAIPIAASTSLRDSLRADFKDFMQDAKTKSALEASQKSYYQKGWLEARQ